MNTLYLPDLPHHLMYVACEEYAKKRYKRSLHYCNELKSIFIIRKTICRSYLQKGNIFLDMEVNNLEEIVDIVLENLINSNQVFFVNGFRCENISIIYLFPKLFRLGPSTLIHDVHCSMTYIDSQKSIEMPFSVN